MRGPELQAGKPPRAFRVLVLGDSVAGGIGVPNRSGHPAVAGRIARWIKDAGLIRPK